MQQTIITAQELIEREFTQKRTDPNLVKNDVLFSVQYNSLRPTIGDDFYDDLIASMPDNTLTTAEQSLIDDYIKPYLLPVTYAQVLPDIVYNSSSQGIMLNQPEFTSNGGRAGLQLMRETAAIRANAMKERLLDYLCDNTSTFTLFCNQSTSTKQHGGIILY